MTEAEWLVSTDPTPMLEFLSDKAAERKLRLFAVACCRQVWPLLFDERSRDAVELVELFADGLATQEELARASLAAFRAYEDAFFDHRSGAGSAATTAYNTTRTAPITNSDGTQLPFHSTHHSVTYVLSTVQDCSVENERLSGMLKGIFGNPFRLVSIEPTWQTPTVLAIAHAAYENRNLPAGTLDPDRLAVLADALEDAGCTSADILNHLRQPGEHVRGCWVVDLLLGKS
jgi:hypothetical protein